MTQGKPYSARLAYALATIAGNIHADGSSTKRRWPGVRLASEGLRRRQAPIDFERPLLPAERLRRRLRVEKLCRQYPGIAVLGRYNVVQYPYEYTRIPFMFGFIMFRGKPIYKWARL